MHGCTVSNILCCSHKVLVYSCRLSYKTMLNVKPGLLKGLCLNNGVFYNCSPCLKGYSTNFYTNHTVFPYFLSELQR